MKLIVGLGNPGPEYRKTRHNMGFLTVERFLDKIGYDFEREAFQGRYVTVKNPRISEEPFIVLEPLTFMNLSGNSVREIVNYFKIDIDDIVVVFDDMDTPPGSFRMREKGSSGGHKGMQSIIEQLGTPNIKRAKIGIGKAGIIPVVDYVLGKPSKEDQALIDQAIEEGANALVYLLSHDFDATMSVYNTKHSK